MWRRVLPLLRSRCGADVHLLQHIGGRAHHCPASRSRPSDRSRTSRADDRETVAQRDCLVSWVESGKLAQEETRRSIAVAFSKPPATSKRRQFVLILILFIAADEPLFQESPRKILAAGSKCNCEAKHDGSKSNSEGNEHRLLGDAQFFERH